jgi:HPt (histidine-containing phosphotransfer) domain-containing protein
MVEEDARGEGPVLDRNRIRALLEVMPASTFQEIVTIFLSGLNERLAAVTSAHAAAKPGPLAEIAHQLKGAAKNLGAARLGWTAGVVEAAARNGVCDENLLKPLMDAARETRSALLAEVGTPQDPG